MNLIQIQIEEEDLRQLVKERAQIEDIKALLTQKIRRYMLTEATCAMLEMDTPIWEEAQMEVVQDILRILNKAG